MIRNLGTMVTGVLLVLAIMASACAPQATPAAALDRDPSPWPPHTPPPRIHEAILYTKPPRKSTASAAPLPWRREGQEAPDALVALGVTNRP